MKFTCFIFSLLTISCGFKEKRFEANQQQSKATIEKVIEGENELINKKLTFEEIQDSLRKQLLNAKPNKNLKSSILQELYIRGLVNQVNNKIKFKLPFNLHGFDCGAPDCYSTDIIFDIPAKNPIEFPKTVNFKLREHGCGIENEILKFGIFELIENSTKYVNYYAKKPKGHLIILGDKKELYFFPDTKINSVKVNLIDKILDEYNDEDTNAIIPYRSTIMTTKDYMNFIIDSKY